MVNEGRKHLLKVIESYRSDDVKLKKGQERVAKAYYYLAFNELKRKQLDINIIDQYIKTGLKLATEEKLLTRLQDIAQEVKLIKSRQSGVVTYFNQEKQWGLIKSDNLSYIFFPSSLTWFCKDFQSLVNSKVSFIPIRDSSGIQATQIHQIKTNKSES
jgi:hypothetical protein